MNFEEIPFLAWTGFVTIALGLLVLVLAYQNAKNKRLRNHKRMMQLATFLLFAFLGQYITRFLTVGDTKFSGNGVIRNYVYLPVLIVHISTAIITIALLIVHITKSTKNEIKGLAPQFPSEYRGKHRSFGKLVFRLWLISYLGGIIVFILLYLI